MQKGMGINKIVLVFVGIFLILALLNVGGGYLSWIEKAPTPEQGGYGEAIIGDGEKIYAVRCMYATSQPQFWMYNHTTDSWSNLPVNGLPVGAFRSGTSLAIANGQIYALCGGRYEDTNRTLFYKFDGTQWIQLSNTPHSQGAGNALVYCGYDGNLYAFLGSAVHNSIFARYFITNNTWEVLPSIWNKTDDGCSLAWSPTTPKYIYALQGEADEIIPNNNFARFNIETKSWEALSSIPQEKGVGDGASLLCIGYYIFAIGGGGADESPGYDFYCYYIYNDEWEKIGKIPYPVGYYVGNRLAYADTIYYWQGAPSTWNGGGNKFCKFSIYYPKIIFVDDDFTDDPSNHKWNSIEKAIDDANDGDTIFVFNGNYSKNIFVNKEVRIVGMDENVLINGIGKEYAINILSENVIIENIKIENASRALIKTFDNSTIKNCSLMANNITGIEIFSNNVSVINCTIERAFIAIDANGRNMVVKNLTVKNPAKGWGILLNSSKDCVFEEISLYGIENKSIKIEKSSNITLSKISINNSFCGILLLETNNSSFSFLNLSENKIGIKIEKSFNNTIRDCNFLRNIGYGIYLENSFNNSIYHNNFIDNGINAFDDGANIWNKSIGNYWSNYTGKDENMDGIADEPYIYLNCIDFLPLINKIEYPPSFVWVDDGYNEQTAGWKIDHFSNLQEAIDAVVNGGKCRVYSGNYEKVLINKSLEVFSDESAKIISSSDAIVISAENVKMSGFEIISNKSCILIQNSKNVSIFSCNVKNGTFGIYLINSLNCSISNSLITGNTKGIYLFNSSFINIFRNKIIQNSYFGIEMSHNSSNNRIYDCSIENNGYYGIYMVSSNNSIWHNNFINNSAYDNGKNEWNSTYEKALGNYWSNYTGKDENMDGIADEPYIIDGGAKDFYPLINKISSPPRFAWVSKSYNASIPGWGIDHFSNLKEAVNLLQEGGGCFVFAGLYEENVRVDKEVFINGANATIDGKGGNALNLSGNNISIYNLVIRNCWSDAGIKIFGENVSIRVCNIYNNHDGVEIYGKNAKVENCSIHDNSFNGIYVGNSAMIKNCSIYNNNNGIFIKSNSNRIENSSFNNCIICVKIVNSSANELYKNNFRESIYGAYLSNSSKNIFYFNNFIDNGINAFDDGANIWNKSIGNYWSNYTGKDENMDG
ncbi:MAG: NosD domain-containing protein, partial [Candidatus Thermoplasmatota archaeon]